MHNNVEIIVFHSSWKFFRKINLLYDLLSCFIKRMISQKVAREDFRNF